MLAKKVLFYMLLVVIVITTLPYVAICAIAMLYVNITGLVLKPLSYLLGGSAPLPKWFDRFCDWVEYLTGKSL